MCCSLAHKTTPESEIYLASIWIWGWWAELLHFLTVAWVCHGGSWPLIRFYWAVRATYSIGQIWRRSEMWKRSNCNHLDCTVEITVKHSAAVDLVAECIVCTDVLHACTVNAYKLQKGFPKWQELLVQRWQWEEVVGRRHWLVSSSIHVTQQTIQNYNTEVKNRKAVIKDIMAAGVLRMQFSTTVHCGHWRGQWKPLNLVITALAVSDIVD